MSQVQPDDEQRLVKLEDTVRTLEQGQTDILAAIQANTDITQPIADLLAYARWFFSMLGWLGKWGRKTLVWTGPVAAGATSIWIAWKTFFAVVPPK